MSAIIFLEVVMGGVWLCTTLFNLEDVNSKWVSFVPFHSIGDSSIPDIASVRRLHFHIHGRRHHDHLSDVGFLLLRERLLGKVGRNWKCILCGELVFVSEGAEGAHHSGDSSIAEAFLLLRPEDVQLLIGHLQKGETRR